jgi:hypothetical protein
MRSGDRFRICRARWWKQPIGLPTKGSARWHSEKMAWLMVSASFAAVFSEGHVSSPVSANVAGECNAITNGSFGESGLTCSHLNRWVIRLRIHKICRYADCGLTVHQNARQNGFYEVLAPDCVILPWRMKKAQRSSANALDTFVLLPDSSAHVQSPFATHHSPARACVSPAGGSVAVSSMRDTC